MNKLTTTFIVFATALSSAHAEKKTALQKSGESDLQVIRTQIGFSTLIELPPDQEIIEITCGDKEFWVVDGKGRFLHVKPAKPGIVTNLNVIVKGDLVHSFVLKEITKSGGGKEKPDLRVVVPRAEEEGRPPAIVLAVAEQLAKLQQDKENLEEALARAEREAKQLKERGEEKKQAQKKTEDEGPPLAKPVVDPKPTPEATAVLRTPEPQKPVTPVAPTVAAASTEVAPDFRVYKIERGVLRTGGRFFSRLLGKVSRALRLY